VQDVQEIWGFEKLEMCGLLCADIASDASARNRPSPSPQ